MCVHWRRKDFIRAHGKELPSIKGTADQLKKLLHVHNLSVIFVATDAPQNGMFVYPSFGFKIIPKFRIYILLEIDELRNFLPTNVALKTFNPSQEILQKYKDGGVAIIDQWICSHAR